MKNVDIHGLWRLVCIHGDHRGSGDLACTQIGRIMVMYWIAFSGLSRSGLEQAAWEEMSRREAWDKECESQFHWYRESERRKEEDARRAAWDEDYCYLLKPVYGDRKDAAVHCRVTRAVNDWLCSHLTLNRQRKVERFEHKVPGYSIQTEKIVF